VVDVERRRQVVRNDIESENCAKPIAIREPASCPRPRAGTKQPSCLRPVRWVPFSVRFWFFLVFLVTPLVPLGAQTAGAGLSLDADSTTLDQVSGESVLQGNASLVHGETTLRAREIRFNFRTRIATARGNVILQMQDRRVLAEEITYRLTDKSLDVKNLRAGVSPVYVTGTQVRTTSGGWQMDGAKAFLHEPGPWSPVVQAQSLLLREDKTLELVKGRLGLGPYTLLPLPGVPIPMDEVFFRYLSVGAGYRKSLGAFFEVGMHLPIASGFEVGADVGYYSSRGIMAGPSGVYRRSTGDRSFTGAFSSGFIHDSGDKQRDLLGVAIPEDRALIHWEHRHQFSESLSVILDLDYWSDSEVVRDFRPKEFYPVQQTDTFIQAEYTGNNSVLTGLTRLNLNRYFQVQERLPELQFSLLPMLIGPQPLALYQRAHASVVRLREDAPLTGPTLRSDRINVYYALSRPYLPREWLSLKPVVGAQVTHYAKTATASDKGHYTRVLGEVGLDAELRTSATYEVRNPSWKIEGLRHLLTPRLGYRYLPSGSRGRVHLPQIDRRAFATYLQPLDLGDQRNVDEIDDQNTIRLQLDNLLQTRDTDYGSRNLVHFNLAVDLRLDRSPGERTLSDLHTELSLTPTRWMRFDVYQRYAPSAGKLRELNTGLTITNSEWWSLRLGTHYLERSIEEYVAEGTVRFNEVYEAFARMHYDSRQARFVQQTYGIHHTLDNLWVLSYGFNFYEGRRREGSFGFVVEVDAARF
jgi:LPS-assembly protein